MNTRRKTMDARARRGRVAKLLLAGVLFVGLFIHIGMLAGISGETKRADALGREMVELSAQRDNLEVSLSMLKTRSASHNWPRRWACSAPRRTLSAW